MSATEDESQDLDAGWDDDDDSGPGDSAPSVPSTPPASASLAPATEEVDEGWDDEPAVSAPAAGQAHHTGEAGKPRRHRQRRAKAAGQQSAAAPILMPRPAERNKREQRAHARQQRQHEAQVKQQRKVERKTERAEQARKEAAERAERAAAEEQSRAARREAQERAASERARTQPARAKPAKTRATEAKPRPAELKRHQAGREAEVPQLAKRSARPWLFVVLLAVGLVVGFFLLKK